MIERLIKKIGLDRIAHFGIGAAVCAFVTNMFVFSVAYGDTLEMSWRFTLLCPLAGYWVVFLAGLCKEILIDTRPDKWDFLATMLGCVFVHIGMIIGYAFHFGNGRDLITTTCGWILFGGVFAILAGLWIWWVVRFNRKGEGGKG